MAAAIHGTYERLYCVQCGEHKPETEFSQYARGQAIHEPDECRCQPCIDKLFKRRLGKNTGEIAAYIKEDREKLNAKYRVKALEQMQGDGRWGTVMHSNELIRRLQKIIPGLVPGPGLIGDDVSLYRVRNTQVDFICWTHQGYLPEFSIAHFDKDNRPIREQRGWRTVLLRLITKDVITEQQAEKEFGRPSSPHEARFWAENLYLHRNNRNLKLQRQEDKYKKD